MPIYCKDCKHVRNRTEAQTWWQCALTKTIRMTDGGENYELCSIARCVPAQCGIEARWFEQRDGTNV